MLSADLAWGWWVYVWKDPHPSRGQLASRTPEVREIQPVLHPGAQGWACRPRPEVPCLPSLTRYMVVARAGGQHCQGLGWLLREGNPRTGKAGHRHKQGCSWDRGRGCGQLSGGPGQFILSPLRLRKLQCIWAEGFLFPESLSP